MPPSKLKSLPKRKIKLPRKDCRNLSFYKNFLYTKTISFPCPVCSVSVLPRDYEKHCKSHHHLNILTCCAWCKGNKTWPEKCKSENANHLLQCSRNFLTLNTPRSLSTPSTFDRSPICPEKVFFDCTPSPQSRAYDPVWSMPLAPTRPVFDLDSLNRAASCLRMYLDLRNDTVWYHIIVRSIAFQSFLAAMDADLGRTRTLSFSCWCDGGKYAETRLRHHRHMIVVAPSHDHFQKNIWKKIKIATEDRPNPHFRILHKTPIQSPLHFVHTLAYVSRRESICEFSGDRPQTSRATQNHFYCFESLPKDFLLPLVLQWEGGLRELLNETFRHLKWGNLVRADLFFTDRKYHCQVQNIPGIRFGLILPVIEEFAPCPQPTDVFLHLLEGRKLYFKYRRLCYSNPQSRLNEQTDMTFYEVVGRNLWTPRPFLQQLLHEFRPLLDRNRELEFESAQLRDILEKERQSFQLEKVQWKATCEHDMLQWQKQVETLKMEKLEREAQHHKEKAKLQEERDAFQFDRMRWREKHEVSVQEIISLLKKVNELLETDTARLKGELDELKRKNEALEREAKQPRISFHVTRTQGESTPGHRKC